MNERGFFRIKKLKGPSIVLAASRHNKRAIQRELGASGHIDASRSQLNTVLHGPTTPLEVSQLAKDLMVRADIAAPRKAAVLALEVIFSLPPDTAIELHPYFSDCLNWAALTFGGIENVLSADVHRDEAAPHMHVLILPLINGRMKGSELVGNRQRLLHLQSDFHSAVAGRYGLSKAPPRLMGQAREKTAQAVITNLRERDDGAQRSVLWPTLRQLIERDPALFAQELGLPVQIPPPARLRTMAEIFTSKGKGSNVREMSIGFPVLPMPIGNVRKRSANRPLSCVGGASSTALATGPTLAVISLHDGDRDVDERVVDRTDSDFGGWADDA